MALAPLATALAFTFAIVLAAIGVRRRQIRPPFPPGPRGYPLIGSALGEVLFSIDMHYAWSSFGRLDNTGALDWRLFAEHRVHWGIPLSFVNLNSI